MALQGFGFSVIFFPCLLHLKLQCTWSGKGISLSLTSAYHPVFVPEVAESFSEEFCCVFESLCVKQRKLAH